MNLVTLGELIKSARNGENISQEKLAKKIGCSRATLIGVEKGAKSLKWEQMVKLKEILKLRIKV